MPVSLKRVLVVFSLALLSAVPGRAQGELSLDKLPVITTIAYITAHPDDESGPVIAYFARGLGARVVILCLTRGEGGQNTYGPELGEELGWLRTRELEEAARIYGAEVRFLGAVDFGYSKAVEETLEKWNEPALLDRLVRVLRELKPDVVITRWTAEAPAGAQHQAAGVLSQKAYPLVGDPAYVTEGLAPWPVRHFVVHVFGPGGEESLRVPVTDTDPESFRGKTFEEIGWEGIRQHRTQGLDRIPRFTPGARQYFLRVAARREPASIPREVRALVERLDALPRLYPEAKLLADWEARLAEVVARLRIAEEGARAGEPAAATRALLEGAAALDELRKGLSAEPAALPALRMVADREEVFLRAAAHLAGILLTARASQSRVVPGERFQVRIGVTATSRDLLAASGIKLRDARLEVPEEWRIEATTSEAAPGALWREFNVLVPERANPTAFGRAPLEAKALLAAGALEFELREPVPDLVVVPQVVVALEPELRLVPLSLAAGTLDWEVRVEMPGSAERLWVGLEVPTSWTPPRAQTHEAQKAQGRLSFQTLLPARLQPGSQTVRALACSPKAFGAAARPRGGELDCPDGGVAAAPARVEIVDVAVPNGLRIGYVGFNNDPVPALLAELGIGVDMLDEGEPATAVLDSYDAVVIAERAYDFRPDLAAATPRLLAYVTRGGTLVVEHQGRGWDPAQFAPYPARNPGGLRITDETAPVRVLVPDHPVLNFPHRIGPADWEGWVQERGLYFLSQWDERWTPLLEMADPGEEPLRGGLLAARSGNGTYIYSGLALFRQVRAGVPGGIRLFVNLLSQRRAPAVSD